MSIKTDTEQHLADVLSGYLKPSVQIKVEADADVYTKLKSSMPGWRAQGVRCISAGTIEHVRTIGVGGDSETLGKVSRGVQDHRIISALSYMHGIT